MWASACGSRTGLGVASLETPLQDGAAPDGDAAGTNDAADARDVVDAPAETDAVDVIDAPRCGLPWVLFSLASATDDGAMESYQIYALRSDGSEGHVLTLPITQVAYPSVSPDGTELLYANASLSGLYLYRFGDGTNGRLDTQGGIGEGSVSPDGRTVVFGDGQNLYLVGAGVDGGTEQSLVVEMQPNAAGSPVFTQDSQTVVYSTQSLVQSIGVDGSGTRTLLTDTSRAFPALTLSPDFSQLAVVVSCGGAPALRVYPLASLPAPCDSGRVVTTVEGPPDAYGPSWGPTGLIAYTDDKDIILVSSAGGSPVTLTAGLTSTTTRATSPTWAPACTVLP
jgi:WD40 repeat protein